MSILEKLKSAMGEDEGDDELGVDPESLCKDFHEACKSGDYKTACHLLASLLDCLDDYGEDDEEGVELTVVVGD